MNKAFRFAITPNEAQKILMAKTFGCVRYVYNKMLSERMEYYELTGERLHNTPAQYKKEAPWLKEVDSLALCNAQLNLNRAYTHFFRKTVTGFPKYKSKRNSRQSYTTNRVNNNIRLEEDRLILPKLGGVKIRLHRTIPEEYTLKSVTISRSASGKYHASLLYEYEEEIPTVEPKIFVGLDYSMKELVVTSDGLEAGYPRYYRSSLEKLKKAQKKLSRCKIGSRNRDKERIKVARLHEKITNQRKDFLHKLSRQITNGADAVCVEDLNMKAMSRSLNFGMSVMDNGYGMLLSMMDYKLKEQGKLLVRIDKWFPSSKKCSGCGEIKEHLSLSERTFQCSACGLEMDRDRNASINIKEEGRRQLLA